ncbi:MAG: ATP-binding cassette domain-containing protein [Alphaproteobacteria bacterium]|nr:ATP-binding cassette domain-containing protein [Alphaproteobacteria bacterium]
MNNILQTQKINKSYVSPVETLTVFKDLDFNLQKGKSLFLFGPSGCGKSTFLNMITGLDEPDSGKVLINNKSLNISNSSNFLKSDIGIIFQDHYLLNELNIKDNLMLKSEKEEQLDFLLNFLDIKDIKLKYPFQISNGQKQRVCVARSLMNKPQLIIADEPTSYLDKVNSDKVIELLINYTKQFNTSLVVSSHDISYKNLFDFSYTIKDMKLIKC